MAKSVFGCALLVALPVVASSITMEMVTVGGANNPADPLTGYGSVGYLYRIGKYEVRNSEYAAFLNAVARDDAYGLYNKSMGSTDTGGIIQSGTAGSYTYSVKSGYGNLPVVYVSFYDAARFANWLENGQPTGAQGAGTTEAGSYTMLTSGTSTTNVSTRTAGAFWVIPTENEWYKTAYHQPFPDGGPSSGYWLYPTRSDGVPSNALVDPDPGTNANFYASGYTVGSPVYVTAVGAFENSESFYGTFDQGGNVWEWNQAWVGSDRGVRGGGWNFFGTDMRSSYRYHFASQTENQHLGFRVAALPKEPLLGLARTTADGFRLTLEGSAGLAHRIEVSANLTNWQTWRTVTLPSQIWTTNFTLQPDLPRQFWRASLAQ